MQVHSTRAAKRQEYRIHEICLRTGPHACGHTLYRVTVVPSLHEQDPVLGALPTVSMNSGSRACAEQSMSSTRRHGLVNFASHTGPRRQEAN